jgi:hypothetical protein
MWQLQQLQARHMVLDNSCSSITEYTYLYIHTFGSHFLHVGAHVAAAAAAGTPHGA